MRRCELLKTVVAAMVVLTFALCGCSVRSTHHASSVVQYLYPKKEEPTVAPSIPTLSLPLKVGIAFVPESSSSYRPPHLAEKDRADLMERISAEFRKYPFIHSIELIPSPYLVAEGSFDNLDQLRTMYGVDVMALLSYDQVQHTDEGLLSMSYWTLVGAYVVKGEKNDTSTMLDCAVYDIPSRKMLFRAPGLSHIKGTATPVNLSEQLRKDSLQGFQLASDDLVANLEVELEKFKAKVKERPEEIKILHQPGYRGGGSLDGWSAGLLAAIAGGMGWGIRRRRA